MAAAQTIAPNTDDYQTYPYVHEAPVTLKIKPSGTQSSQIDTYTKMQISEAIKALWGEEGNYAVKVAICESGLNPYAVNWNDAKITGYPSMGIFQLNRPYDEKYFDWRYNLQEAYQLYLKRGFQPWSCSRKLL